MAESEPDNLEMSNWEEIAEVKDVDFPYDTHGKLPLRLNFERAPLAALHAHAQGSLHHEVCGVLVGRVNRDPDGYWVEVIATIRGQDAIERRTEVTFTQETWDSIHRVMETEYSEYQIVGWYHTHPGFGVQFSDMDLFVQTNFFPLPTQVAVVTDPLSGQIAACVNTTQGVEYLENFWVDGRKLVCRRPETDELEQGSPLPANKELISGIEMLERRVTQLLQVVDEQKVQLYQFQFNVMIGALVLALGLIGFNIYSVRSSEIEPPKIRSFAQIPVRIEGEDVLLGIGVVECKIPPRLNSILLQQAEASKKMSESSGQKSGFKWPWSD